MARKPSTKDIKNWDTVYQSDLVVIKQATVRVAGFRNARQTTDYKVVPDNFDGGFLAEFFQVIPAEGRKKTFFGESAWSDARRVASDFDFGAWSAI
jgi:hypothetical protein